MEIVFDKVSFVMNKNTPLEKTILNDISFTISGPGIFSFIGASNSGKSSIGDIMNALSMPTKGKVKIGKYYNSGRSIRNVKDLRFETGYLYKNPYDMFFNKTVSDELSFALKCFKYKMDKINDRVKDALKLVGLDESYLELNPLELKLIDAKKLALACILIYNPSIIILDEYTNGLSSSEKNDLKRLLRMLKTKYKKTIILLSKDTSFCYEITDYVFLLSLTRLVATGKKEIMHDEELLNNLNLEVPRIVSFINECNKKGHDINYYSNILDLIKGVYRDVF